MGYFNEAAQQAALEQLQHSDGMLMGRGTYEYFTAPLPTDSPYADAINAIRKYVFSSTLQRATSSCTGTGASATPCLSTTSSTKSTSGCTHSCSPGERPVVATGRHPR